MSERKVFNRLKYHISDIPTVEELERLPKQLFDMWCKYSWRLEGAALKITPAGLVDVTHNYLAFNPDFRPKLDNAVKKLRDAIDVL